MKSLLLVLCLLVLCLLGAAPEVSAAAIDQTAVALLGSVVDTQSLPTPPPRTAAVLADLQTFIEQERHSADGRMKLTSLTTVLMTHNGHLRLLGWGCRAGRLRGWLRDHRPHLFGNCGCG